MTRRRHRYRRSLSLHLLLGGQHLLLLDVTIRLDLGQHGAVVVDTGAPPRNRFRYGLTGDCAKGCTGGVYCPIGWADAGRAASATSKPARTTVVRFMSASPDRRAEVPFCRDPRRSRSRDTVRTETIAILQLSDDAYKSGLRPTKVKRLRASLLRAANLPAVPVIVIGAKGGKTPENRRMRHMGIYRKGRRIRDEG